MPRSFTRQRNAECESANVSSLISPRPCAAKPSLREAVILGSSCLSVPAAALRGFRNGSSPASSRSRFTRSNSAIGKYTSPRTSSTSGTDEAPRPAASTSGTARMVRTFAVTSSPLTPSPRVSARTSTPRSYRSDIAIPSILASATRRNGTLAKLAGAKSPPPDSG